jgi:small subunit ribosomal protein S14
MAKTALINKAAAKPKFKSRVIRRCNLCGRPRAVYRKFGICRICLRQKALLGEVPGMRKASW